MPSASQRSKTNWSPWAREYARTPERYVFGTAPSDFALEVARLVRPGDYVLDLGCGEGRDSVFFAGRGAVVFGVDLSDAGLRAPRPAARDDPAGRPPRPPGIHRPAGTRGEGRDRGVLQRGRATRGVRGVAGRETRRPRDQLCAGWERARPRGGGDRRGAAGGA